VTKVLGRRGNTIVVIHTGSNIELAYDLLECLGTRRWLNDEVINAYVQLLNERIRRREAEINSYNDTLDDNIQIAPKRFFIDTLLNTTSEHTSIYLNLNNHSV
jgi:hypothetical protein